jgi:hypothetical protein
MSVLATASLNLAEYASITEKKEFDLSIPLEVSGSTADSSPALHVCYIIYVLFLSLDES